MTVLSWAVFALIAWNNVLIRLVHRVGWSWHKLAKFETCIAVSYTHL